MSRTSLSYRIARKLELVSGQGGKTDADGFPVRNAPSPLRPFLPWLVRRRYRRRQRLASESPTRIELDSALELVADEVRAQQSVQLPADGIWHDTGMELEPGESITILAAGRLFLSRPLEVSVGARTSLWYRIGDGDIERMSRECEQATASQAGRMCLRAAIPGAFDSPQGDDNPDNPAPALSGALDVRLIRWARAPEESINKAAQLAPSVFEPLRRQLSEPEQSPDGWHYLWRMGKADIFRTDADDGALCCETHGDVGILQYPVDMNLDESLQLSWSWRVETLPSQLSEHIQPTHDYLSIAVEFDNGLDLTYMWSAQLPENTIFQCPLPWWDQRETHWVVRNTQSGLARWHEEQRNILEDYQQAIGGPIPERVVAVWLIANSAFQNGHGRCYYRGINLKDANGTVAIHA